MQGWQDVKRPLILTTMNIARPVTTLDVSFVTYITHEEVHGERYVSEDLVKDLSQLSVEDCLLLISRILINLDNSGYLEKRIQINLALSLLDPAVFEIVENTLTHGKMRVLFFEAQLLALSKYAVLYAKHEKGSNFNEGKLYPGSSPDFSVKSAPRSSGDTQGAITSLCNGLLLLFPAPVCLHRQIAFTGGPALFDRHEQSPAQPESAGPRGKDADDPLPTTDLFIETLN